MDEAKINELSDQISKARAILNDLTVQLEAEKNKVEKKEPSIEDRWKPNMNDDGYYTVDEDGCSRHEWYDDGEDYMFYDNYNIWKNIDRGVEVCEKTKLLWLMEQIHDILCPDYKPDWEDDSEDKYFVYFAVNNNKWLYDYNCCTYKVSTYFDTEEHAEQACKMLNDMGVKPI